MKLTSFLIFFTIIGIPHQICLICELILHLIRRKNKTIKYLEFLQDGFRRDASHASPRVSTSHARAAKLQQSPGTDFTSFADPDPNPDTDPSAPNVFGPPGSGSISHWYASGSGSFYRQAKKLKIKLDS
jgi:hypothetical protein